MSESQLLAKQANPQVFAVPDAQDIMHWTAVVVGPPNTPYSRGMFHFDLRFPNDYPNLPPTVVLRTTSSSTVRFNPNLYNNGKVCLSILGTWRAEAGEQWSSVQNVHSVLMSIQSLMHDKPYHNEPNFEKDDGSGDVQRYNEKIAHETLRVAVVEVMEDTIEGKSTSNGAEPCFDDLRKQLFLMQYACYLATLGEWEQLEHARDGRPFRMMPFECLANGMKGQFAWRALRGRLEAVHGHVLEEISGWRQKGKEQAALVRAASAIGLAPAVSSLQEQLAHLKLEPPEGVSIGADGDNALTVELTVFGPEGTSWEEGCFAVEIVYPPDYPDSCALAARGPSMSAPHVRFRAPVCPLQLPARALHLGHVPPEHQRRWLPVHLCACFVAHHLSEAAHAPGVDIGVETLARHVPGP